MDYDNDGWKDLFIVQSHVMDTIENSEPNLHYREAPALLHNGQGKKLSTSRQLRAAYSISSGRRAVWRSATLITTERLDAVVTSK